MNNAAAQAASAGGAPEYEVVDGAILVFGHRLETNNPLPARGECEGCRPIEFHRSPDGRWILIVSDVMFTDNDIWLYDTRSSAMPRHVVDTRYGKHLETKWYSGNIFEVRWSGMGYRRSLLFDADNSTEGRALGDLLLYDVQRDVYVRHHYENETFTDMIEIGTVFSPAGKTERFPVVLGGTSRADAIYQFEGVRIEGSSVYVTYTTSLNVTVSDEFSPQILAGAQ